MPIIDKRHTSERIGVAAVSERPQRALSEDAHKQRHAGNDREYDVQAGGEVESQAEARRQRERARARSRKGAGS